jgi:hypothetical protein
VLAGFSKDEAPLLDAMLDRAADLAEMMVGEGPDTVIAKATAPKKPAGRNR